MQIFFILNFKKRKFKVFFIAVSTIKQARRLIFGMQGILLELFSGCLPNPNVMVFFIEIFKTKKTGWLILTKHPTLSLT